MPSTGIGSGTLRSVIEYGLPLPFFTVLDSEAISVTLLNFFTGIFAGFAVFGFLGYLAWHMDTSVHDVVDSGIYAPDHRRLKASSLRHARHDTDRTVLS